MAKNDKPEPEAAKAPTPDAKASAMELTKHLDPMIRAQVQGVLLADPALSIDQALRKVEAAIAAGIMERGEARSPMRSAREDADTWPPGTKVSVRRCQGGDFTYGSRTLDRNQVFELSGMRLDSSLARLGYIAMVHPEQKLELCGACGGQFTDAASATAHFNRRHKPKEERPLRFEAQRSGETLQEYEAREAAWRREVEAAEDASLEREDRAEDTRAPLYMDQTKASRA